MSAHAVIARHPYACPRTLATVRCNAAMIALTEDRETHYVARHALHVAGDTVSLLPLRGAVRVVTPTHSLTGTPIHYHLPRT